MRRANEGRSVVAVIGLLLAAACGARAVGGDGAATDAGPQDATAADTGAPEVGCTLVDAQCVGYPKCCGPYTARVLDLDAGCLGAKLSACAQPLSTPSSVCYDLLLVNCSMRVADGGVEYIWGDRLPGYEECNDPDAAERVEQVRRDARPCP